jgi:hypothetical protein
MTATAQPSTVPPQPRRRPYPVGPAPGGGVGRTLPPWPIRRVGASRSPASRSRARGQAAPARAWRCGHVHGRGKAVAIGDATTPPTIGRAGWSRQQGFNERPQIVWQRSSVRVAWSPILPDLPKRSETTSRRTSLSGNGSALFVAMSANRRAAIAVSLTFWLRCRHANIDHAWRPARVRITRHFIATWARCDRAGRPTAVEGRGPCL